MKVEATGLRRIAHPGRVAGFVVVIFVVGIIAFVLGQIVRSPDAAVLEARNETIPIYAAVDQRVVTDEVRIQGEIVPAEESAIVASAPQGASIPVVTHVTAQIGIPLSNGALLGTISDRPIFVMFTRVPLFRDLYRDDSGTDVFSLQEVLGVEATGTMDWDTLDAVRTLYDSVGIEPPGGWRSGTFVRMSEFYHAPPGSIVTLSAVAPVGTVLTNDLPFARLQSGAPHVALRASANEASRIAIGAEVVVYGPNGSKGLGTVSSIGSFDPAATNSGRPPGRDMVVSLPLDSNISEGATVSVLFGTASDPSLAVPTIAIRSDAAGEYVLARDGEKRQRVDVTVLRTANGWSAIDTDEIGLGDEVLVSR